MRKFWDWVDRIWVKIPGLKKLKDPWERFTAVAAFLFVAAACLDYFAAEDVSTAIRGGMKAAAALFGGIAIWLPVREVRSEAERHRQSERVSEDRNRELESQIEERALLLLRSMLEDSFIPLCNHLHFLGGLSPEQRSGYENGLKHRIATTAHSLAGKDHYRTSFYEYSNAGKHALLRCDEVSYGRTPSPKPIKGNSSFGSTVMRSLESGGCHVLQSGDTSLDFAKMVMHPVAAGARIFGIIAIDTREPAAPLTVEHHGLVLSVLAEWLSTGILLCRETSAG
ncbi:hypothetical protein ACPC54_36840 [Kitasatospora sp. NPDC094028]